MKKIRQRSSFLLITVLVCASVFLFGEVAEAAWPERPIEFIIMAGTGGGADRYARFLISINTKDKLIDEAILPVNKAGGAGAVAMQYVLSQKGNNHMMMITLNSFLTTPLFQNLPFNYKSFTPLYLVALDNFPLWVHKDAKWKTAMEFIEDAKTRSILVGGTGSKQEDEIVWRTIEAKMGTKPFKYVPYKGGGDVAKALVGKEVEATVNQVSEAGPFYPEFTRPLCVFQEKRLTAEGYENVPTGNEVGIPIEYTMMRGIFGPPGMSDEAVKGFIDLFDKLVQTQMWKDFASKSGLMTDGRTGAEFNKFLDTFNQAHIETMKAAGWLK
ncbi:MAG: tripartite tricarboxylate transporter substrate binding protein [bacterium]|nr:MAG: tripartite tricarboxylate transporter substrate binding protein [bacterium]